MIGQEITPETFIQSDNYMCSQHNLIRRLIADNSYGLVPCGDKAEVEGTLFAIKPNIDNKDLYVERLVCIATTAAGYLIDIDSQLWNTIYQKHLSIPDSAAKNLYLVLRVNPFEQVLIEPVMNEEAPMAHPAFSLQVRELDRIGDDEMAILKIDNTGYTAKIDPDYIPPSMSMNACPKLLETYGLIKQLLSEVQFHTKNKGELSGATRYQLSMLYDDLQDFAMSNKPIDLIRLVRKIIRTYQFFVSNIRSIDFPDLLRSYNHNDMSITFKLLLSFLQNVIRIVSQGVEEEDFTPKI